MQKKRPLDNLRLDDRPIRQREIEEKQNKIKKYRGWLLFSLLLSVSLLVLSGKANLSGFRAIAGLSLTVVSFILSAGLLLKLIIMRFDLVKLLKYFNSKFETDNSRKEKS